MDLVEALQAEDAAVAVVGAGGKKTTMYALADRLPRAILTATVRIPIFDDSVERVRTTSNPAAACAAVDPDDYPLGLVPERDRADRYRGYDPEVVDDLIAAHDGSVVIKADGARLRDFKAPNDREPQIPSAVDVVVPIVSAAVVGEPLDSTLVHRPERVVRVAGGAGIDVSIGDRITPTLVGAVLASPIGGFHGIPDGATVIPLINKVDDAGRETTARAIAEAIRLWVRARRTDAERSRVSVGSASTPRSYADGRAIEVPHVVLGRLRDGVVVATIPI